MAAKPALPLPLTEQAVQDHSFTKINSYSSTSPGQVPFHWEAEPGKPRKKEEEEKEKEEPPPLNLPPIRQSPAVSRASSTRSITSNGYTPSHPQDLTRRYAGLHVEADADVPVFRSSCNLFSCCRSPQRFRMKR